MPATFSASPVAKAKAQDLTCDLDLSPEELLDLLDLTHKVKISPARYAQALSGRYLSLLFEKPDGLYPPAMPNGARTFASMKRSKRESLAICEVMKLG